MKIVGCDLHTRYQQIAMLDEETGELVERRLEHASGEAKEFYASLVGQVRVGIEGGWPNFDGVPGPFLLLERAGMLTGSSPAP